MPSWTGVGTTATAPGVSPRWPTAARASYVRNQRSTCPGVPRMASSVPGALSCTLRLSPPPSPRTPPEGGQQRPTRMGVYASSVRRGRGRDRGKVRGRDRGIRTAHTHAHARTHTRARATLPHARATLPLHTHARTRHTAAAPLPPRCCLPAAAPLLRGAASAALLPRRRLCGAAAAPLPRRCCHGAATRRLFALEPACKGLSPAW